MGLYINKTLGKKELRVLMAIFMEDVGYSALFNILG